MDEMADYDGTDVYCDVALPHPELLDVVRETEHVLAFHHTRPSYEMHVIVVPKRHIRSLTSLELGDEPVVRELLEAIHGIAVDIERSLGAARVVTNIGEYQDSKHLHVHVVGGERVARLG